MSPKKKTVKKPKDVDPLKPRYTTEPAEKVDAQPPEMSQGDAYAQALKDVKGKLSEIYEGGMVLSRLTVFMAWLDRKLDRSAPEQKAENAKAEGADA